MRMACAAAWRAHNVQDRLLSRHPSNPNPHPQSSHLCLHPRFGPWFSLRCVIIFDNIPWVSCCGAEGRVQSRAFGGGLQHVHMRDSWPTCGLLSHPVAPHINACRACCMHTWYSPLLRVPCVPAQGKPKPAELPNPLPAATQMYVKMTLHSAVHNTR